MSLSANNENNPCPSMTSAFLLQLQRKKKSNAKFYYLLFSWWRRHKNVFHKSNKFQLNNAPNFLQPRTYKATKSLSTEIQTTIWEQLKFKKIGLVMLQHSKNRHQNLHSLIQPLIHVWLFATPWIAACQAYLSITNSQSLLKVVSIESVIPSMAWTHVSYVSWIGRWVFFTTSATWEAPDHPLCLHIAFWNSIKDSNPPFRANPTLGVWTFSSLEKGVKALFFSLANISVNCFTTKVSSPNTDNNTFLNILLRVSLVFQTR